MSYPRVSAHEYDLAELVQDGRSWRKDLIETEVQRQNLCSLTVIRVKVSEVISHKIRKWSCVY